MSDHRRETIVDKLRERARLTPHAELFSFFRERHERKATLSYAELHAESMALAAHLADRGLAGQRALLLYPPGLEFVVAMFGCMIASVQPIPMPMPRGKHHLKRIEAVSSSVQIAAVLTAGRLHQRRLEELFPELVVVDTTALPESAALRNGNSSGGDGPTIDSVALLQFTSGSTGEPRGVAVTHRNIAANQSRIAKVLGLTSSSVGVGWLPFFHDMGLVGNIFSPVFSGYPMALISPASFLRRPRLWLELMSDLRATASGGPNFAYQLCVERCGSLAGLDLSSWSTAFCGAERIVPQTVEDFIEMFSAAGFRREAFLPCYGLAEATLLVSGAPHGRGPIIRTFPAKQMERRPEPDVRDNGSVRLVGCGFIEAPDRIAIVDGADTRVVAEGAVGEIWIESDSVAAGYVGRARSTTPVFDRYLSDGDGPWLATGDLGFIENGELFVTGRIKEIIIVNGRNFYPHDIEDAISGAVPELNPSACAAYVVPKHESEGVGFAAEIRRGTRLSDRGGTERRIREALHACFELALSEVTVVEPGELPRTTSGKLQRTSVRAYIQEQRGRVPADRPVAASPVCGPIVSVVRDVLRRPISEEDLRHSAAAIGLTSIQAHELVYRMENQLGRRTAVEDIFHAQSLLGLLETLDEQEREGEPETSSQLTETELALLWEHTKSPDSTGLNVCGSLCVRPGLDSSRLRVAFEETRRHHPKSKMVVGAGEAPTWTEGEATQSAFCVVDARSWAEQEVNDEVDRLAQQRFDLQRGPLFRLTQLRREQDDVLVFSCHHIVCDLRSLLVFFRDLQRCYEGARLEGSVPAGGVARWQSRWLRDERGKRAEDFWLSQWMTSAGSDIRWPCDSRASTSAERACRRLYDLGPEKAAATIARTADVRAFHVLFASFLHALSLTTTQERLMVAVPMLGRPDARFSEEFGYLVQTCLFCFDLSSIRTFDALLAYVAGRVDGALPHQWFPMARRTALNLGTPGEYPYQVLFTLDEAAEGDDLVRLAHGETGDLACGNWLVRAGPRVSFRGPEQMAVRMHVRDGRVRCAVDYDGSILSHDAVDRVVECWQRALKSAADDHAAARRRLVPLAASELSVFVGARATPSANWLQRIVDVALQFPDRAAVVTEAERVTYSRLLDMAGAIGCRLDEYDLGREDVVAVLLPRSPHLVAALLAILARGATYLPLEGSHPVARLRYYIEDAQPKVLLVSADLDASDGLGAKNVVALDSRGEPKRSLRVQTLHPEQQAIVIYTSGSTGRPKGVSIRHGGIAALLGWAEQAFESSLREGVAATTSLSFDLSVFELFATLYCGGTIHLFDSPTALLSASNERLAGIRLVNTVPSVVKELVRAGRLPQSLSVLNVAGERLEPSLVEQVRRGYPELQLNNLYGPTEDTTYSTHFVVSSDAVALGMPLPGTELHLANAELEPVVRGALGEILLSGDGLARGYFRSPRLTADRFRPNGVGGRSGSRVYRTGDLARVNGVGQIEFHGRQDEQVKIRGVRVELGEVKSTLESVPGVVEAAAVAAPSPSGSTLLAFITVDRALAAEFVRYRLAQVLPPAAVPSRIVVLDKMPRLANGKLNMKDLANRAVSSDLAVAPSGAREEEFLGLWKDLVGADSVGVTDDFITSGGHSLLLMRFVQTINVKHELELDAAFVLRHSTVRQLASAVDELIQAKAMVLRNVAAAGGGDFIEL